MSARPAGPARRSVLAAAGTTGLAFAITGTIATSRHAATAASGTQATPVAAGHRRVRLALPAPTGPHPIAATSLHLIDRSRQDPWTSSPAPPGTDDQLVVSDPQR